MVDAFHFAHYLVKKWTALVENLSVYSETMRANIQRAGGLLYRQSVLGIFLEAGIDRHIAYWLVQRNAMSVWDGKEKDLESALLADEEVLSMIEVGELKEPSMLTDILNMLMLFLSERSWRIGLSSVPSSSLRCMVLCRRWCGLHSSLRNFVAGKADVVYRYR